MVNILMLNQKGGVGKSLLADELAFSFERTGQKTAFYDLDNQGGTLHQNQSPEDAEVAVIDSPGALQKDLDAWLQDAQVVVIPTLCSSREIEPLMRMIDAVSRYPDKKVLFVLNGFNHYKVATEFKHWFESIRSKDEIVTLRRFEWIVQAGMNEMSIVEYAPSSDAAKDVLKVVNKIRTLAGFPEEAAFKKRRRKLWQ